MKRALIILFTGFAAAALAYLGFYRVGTAEARSMTCCKSPELAWLKSEFKLGDAEFQKISTLHETYLKGCAERCMVIDGKTAALKEMLARTNAVTPEIEKALTEAAQLRAECQKEMLKHFYEVSTNMSPEQGRRYLAWVRERTLPTDTHRTMQ